MRVLPRVPAGRRRRHPLAQVRRQVGERDPARRHQPLVRGDDHRVGERGVERQPAAALGRVDHHQGAVRAGGGDGFAVRRDEAVRRLDEAERHHVHRRVDGVRQLGGPHRAHLVRLRHPREEVRGELDVGHQDPAAGRQRRDDRREHLRGRGADRHVRDRYADQPRERRAGPPGRDVPALPGRTPDAPVGERRLQRVPRRPRAAARSSRCSASPAPGRTARWASPRSIRPP